MRRVLVTGATGFTGSYVVPLLLRADYRVRCFIRQTSNTSVLPAGEVELAYGDLSDPITFRRALDQCDVLVNIASLGFGHAPNVVQSAAASGIRRALFISTTAVETTLNAGSKSIRLAAEETIRQSNLAYTILRPTMIYGSPRDRNMCRLISFLRRWPIVPIFGDGNSLQQPVHVADLATAVVKALESVHAIGKTYNISGAAPVTYNELIDTVCYLMARRVMKIHVPSSLFVAPLSAFERITKRLPIKAEQIQRLNEDKAFDYAAAARDFDYQPRSLAEGITDELREMRLLGDPGC